MKRKPPALLFGSRQNLPYVYPKELLQQIGQCVDWRISVKKTFALPFVEQAKLPLPAEVEVIFSTWGMPKMTEDFLDRLPNLKAVFYGAGSVRNFVTDAVWDRGVRIFSSAKANAVPVAEFTVAQIILGLKKAHYLRELVRAAGWRSADPVKQSMRGNFRSRIGLISYGSIARHVRQLLRGFDLEVWVYDPFLPEEEAGREQIRLVSLDELFQECHAVSLHAPWLPETENLIRGRHFASMRPDAVFINTARGAIVHQEEMTDALRKRPDISAFLDVLHPEPPAGKELLFELPNVWITPHMAGSMGHECGRMGMYAFEAFKDFLSGEPSPCEVTKESFALMA